MKNKNNSQIKERQFDNFLWIDVTDIDKNMIAQIEKKYQLNNYLITDSLQIGHLPKYEKLQNFEFLIMRAYTGNMNTRISSINQITNKIAFFYNENLMITIHRTEFEFLTNLEQNFRTTEEILIYILDKILDTFNKPIQVISEKNEKIEKNIFLIHRFNLPLEEFYYQKTHTRILKKLLLISQNVINLIEIKSHKVAMQDIKEKVFSLVMQYEEEFDNTLSLLQTLISVSDQKSNDVMKLLTIFSAFFLPLTFIVGLYGMNFRYLPELEWKYGYFVVLGLMALISFIIYIWFKRRKIL